MTISPAPARAVAPRRTAAANKPKPTYREPTDSEAESSGDEGSSDYAPSD
jgi:hypothetical protein